MANYDENNVKKNKKGWSLITESTGEQETINLQDFLPENQKGVNIVANSSYSSGYNTITSSFFNDTITAKNGKYDITLKGYGNKKVTTGNFENKFTLGNHGKSTINAGNEKDTYTISNGNNTIVDKGGLQNSYTISGGKNTITDYGTVDYKITNGENNIKVKSGSDKTNYFKLDTVWESNYITSGASSDTYDIYVGGGSYANIKSGGGVDKINIYDTHYEVKPILDIDTGAGDDEVKIDLKYSDRASTNINNIKTGNGSDTVEIKSGALNKIDTGNDGDTVKIDGGINNYINTGKGSDTVTISYGFNTISTGNDKDIITVKAETVGSAISTIKAGKGDDEITVNGGTNTIYGEAGKDIIKINGGNNTVYGGGDEITATDGANTIYVNSDKKVNLSGGVNTVNTTNGKNTIDVTGGTKNTINLSKGNNTVNVSGGTNEDYTRATVDITSGKNTVNIGGYSISSVNSTTKTTQTIIIKENAFCSTQLGVGNDIIKNSSTAEDPNTIYAGGGNDKIYISAGDKNVEGEEGNDYFELSGGSGHYVKGGDGNDTFDIKETLNTEKINSIDGGTGKDTFNIEGGKSIIEAMEGDDIINLKKGSENTIYGQQGVDTFNISGGSGNNIHGNVGNDVLNITGGENNSISGDDDEDNFIVSGGKSNNIYGGEANDIFTINSGYLNHYYGGNGSDTFNIKGGKFTYIDGDIGTETGDDIYNLNIKSEDSFVLVNDSSGNNTVNVSKGYKGASSFSATGSAKYSLNFDKSYKLTNSSNVKDDVVKTTDSNITIYGKFVYNNTTPDDSYFDEGWGYQFIVNAQNEIKDNEINNRFINGTFNSLSSIKVGGADYTLNLDQLKSDLVAWFSMDAHSGYADSKAVFDGKNEADINSLMAVYTKDTAECFQRV